MGFRVSPDTVAEWERRGLIATAPPAPVAPIEERVNEKEFMAAVVALAKRNGWLVHHHYDSRKSEAGWPDLVLIRAGKLILAELKKHDGKVSAAQTTWIEALRGCGIDVRVWRPSDFEKIVEVLK